MHSKGVHVYETNCGTGRRYVRRFNQKDSHPEMRGTEMWHVSLHQSETPAEGTSYIPTGRTASSSAWLLPVGCGTWQCMCVQLPGFLVYIIQA